MNLSRSTLDLAVLILFVILSTASLSQAVPPAKGKMGNAPRHLVDPPKLAEDRRTPALPAVEVDIRYPAKTGRSISVELGGDLQAALNDAQPGDEVVIAAGASFTGHFILPAKDNPEGKWIVIRSSRLEELPEHRRVHPEDQAKMATLITADSSPALSNDYSNREMALRAASYWRIAGIEITTTPANQHNYALATFDGFQDATSVDAIPHHITFDRSYVHGNETGDIIRALALNGDYMAVIDSHLSDAHATGWDSQAICSWDGRGPFRFENNYLEAAGENVMFGGEVSPFKLTAADIVIRNNYFTKPMTWFAMHKDPKAPKRWVVKNLLEFKTGQRVLVTGNLLENNWNGGQTGYAIVVTPRSSNGVMPLVETSDITIENNIIRHVGGGLATMAVDDGCPVKLNCAVSRLLTLRNNLFQDVNTNYGQAFVILAGSNRNLTLENNTFLTNGLFTIYQSSFPFADFTMRNNILNHDVAQDSLPGGDAFRGGIRGTATIENNAFIGLGERARTVWRNFRPNTLFVDDEETLRFLPGYAGLCSDSPFRGIGASLWDFDENAVRTGAIVNFRPDDVQPEAQSTRKSRQ